MDFIIDNWPWLLAIVVFFVMAIIGYYSEKTGYTKKIKFKKEKELPTFDIDVDPSGISEEHQQRHGAEPCLVHPYVTSVPVDNGGLSGRRVANSIGCTIPPLEAVHADVKRPAFKHLVIEGDIHDGAVRVSLLLGDIGAELVGPSDHHEVMMGERIPREVDVPVPVRLLVEFQVEYLHLFLVLISLSKRISASAWRCLSQAAT